MDNLEQFLRELPLFSTFSDESMKQMLTSATIKTYESEETAIHHGQPGTFLGIVLEGEMQIVGEDQPGQRRLIRKMVAGECFGEMSLMTGDPTSASVVACAGCRTVMIPDDVFSNTIAVNPDSVRHLAKLMTRRLREDNINMSEQIQLSEETTHVVSHELKSPFASIATLAMAILEPKIPMEKKEQFLQRIISKALGAKTMIEEYLTLSAISANGVELTLKEVNLLSEVVEEALDHQREIMSEKGMSAAIHIPKNLKVVCDPEHIQIVYNNLITNAAKYGTKGTEIYLGHAEPHDGYHYFSVANTGEWIEEGDRVRIFEKYVRLGRRGTGIGLYTTKEIVRKHGGDIWVEPCYFAEGKYVAAEEISIDAAANLPTGNNFIFTLPEIGLDD